MTYDGFLACCHPDDRDYVHRMWSAAMLGAPYDIEHRVVVDGVVKWVREKADLRRDDYGRVIGGIGITQDITERRLAEESLRVAEARASGILAVSADAIVVVDDNFQITMFNDGAVKMFGYTQQEVIGAPLATLLPERFRTIHQAHLQAFMAAPETARRMGQASMTIRGRRRDGQEFPADATISKLEVGGKRILTVSVRDITEQTRIAGEQQFLAEVATVLAESLDYKQTLHKVAELAVRDREDVCVIDMIEIDGDLPHFEVIGHDPRLATLSQLLAQLPVDRSRPHLLQATLEGRRAHLLERVPLDTLLALLQTEEYRHLLDDNAECSVITVPLLAYERLLGGIALVSSTSSRVYSTADVKLAEELARRAALSIENAHLYHAAHRAIRARDDVLSIVAHDLRNPLNAVRLQAQIIAEYGAAAPGEARSAATTIERATGRMNRLIEDLLDISRLDAGTLRVESAPVAVADVVGECVEAHTTVAAKAAVGLRHDLAGELPSVWGDRSRLLQVLDNLIGNALKFTPRGGAITVAAKPSETDIVFSVRDTGVGIPADVLPHVFDRFWQARRVDRRGAGLGLAITRGIVEAHHGRIWVESEVGHGTTVYFTIPRAPPAAQVVPAEQALP